MLMHHVKHALVEDVLARLRDRQTSTEEFRRLARRVSYLLIAEATRDLLTSSAFVETPMERASAERLAQPVVAVPVLRSGVGMLEAFLELVPDAQVGYVGLERDEKTAVARRYYEKVPRDIARAAVFLLDPMLATGGSAVMALQALAEMGVRGVRVLSIVAAPEGIARVEKDVPDARVYTAALDRGLNDRKFILPGLGDFGDRLYGT
jgi:uracil phosphoribosyltransferase